jgi:hypothetical protein
VGESDFGQYGCRADNPLGSDYAFISLRPSNAGFFFLPEGSSLFYAVLGASVGLGLCLVLGSVAVCVLRRRKSSNSPGQQPLQQLNNEQQQPILKNKTAGGATAVYLHQAPDLLDSMSLISGQSNREPMLLPLRLSSHEIGAGSRQLNSLLPSHAGYYGNAQLAGRGTRQFHSRGDEEDDRMSRSSSQSGFPPSAHALSGRPGVVSRRSPSPQYISDANVDYSTSSTMSSVLSRGSRSNR